MLGNRLISAEGPSVIRLHVVLHPFYEATGLNNPQNMVFNATKEQNQTELQGWVTS